MVSENVWVDETRIGNAQGKLILFCFPFEGGGSSTYAKWNGISGDDIVVCPVNLPGRERRIKDPLIEKMPQLIDELELALSPYLNQRYAFFGHSMGGLISYLLSVRLASKGLPLPEHLFISARGYVHPDKIDRLEPYHLLSDNDFIAMLGEMSPDTVTSMQDPAIR